MQPQVLNSSSSGHSEFPDKFHPSARIGTTAPGLLDVPPKQPSAMNRIDQALWSTERAIDLSFDNSRNAVEKKLSLVNSVNLFPNVEQRLDRNVRGTVDSFAAIFHSSPVILCIIRLSDYLCVEINKMYEKRTGYCRSEVISKSDIKLGLWSNVKDRDRVIEKIVTTGRYTRHQTTFRTKAGKLLNIFLSAELMEFHGAPCVLVMAEDITMRRQAEKARLKLAQRLVNAQEEECARVGRELHDSIGQSLALLSIELQETKRALAGRSRTSDARFDRLCNKVRDIGDAVGSLSHQLHSSGLEFLGLAGAAHALCREFSERYRVKTRCDSSSVPHDLSPDFSLCLFRILQEALNNVAKHSQAKSLTVAFCVHSKFLRLSIYDDGIGFDPKASKPRPGLGLISMRERLELVGGKFTITAKAGYGTHIEALIPIAKQLQGR